MSFDLSINPEEVITIVKDFIATYVRNSGIPRVVIGLSGGIDSAITTIVCKDALGKINTQCLFMPDESTSKADICHQRLVVNKYDILCKTKDITTKDITHIVQQLN